MRRLVAALSVAALCALAGAPPASADFGLKESALSATDAGGSSSLVAGTHPFSFTTQFELNTRIDSGSGEEFPEGALKDLTAVLPPGLVGSRTPVPYCANADFLNVVEGYASCQDEAAVGVSATSAGFHGRGLIYSPIYNLVPPPGVAAKIGFIAVEVPVTIEVLVSQQPPYNLIARATDVSQAALFYGAKVTLWGNPASPAHDPVRGKCIDIEGGSPTEIPSLGNCEVDIPEKAFITLPRSCSGQLSMTLAATSWSGGADSETTATPDSMSGCEGLEFKPEVTASQPTTDHAESPTGLDFHLDVDDPGLTDPNLPAQSDIKKAVVTLPPGITANPAVAAGLEGCSSGQYANERIDAQGCPSASKIGSVEVETPLLESTVLKGGVFVASQNDNPFNSLLAIYMVIKDPGLGIMVKLPGRVEPDPRTGQLVTTFGEAPHEIPQFPFSHLRFHFRAGERSPLATPAACGKYTTRADLTPWANPSQTLTRTASFEISRGADGGACPPGTPPFSPRFEAGALNDQAGAFSPYYLRMSRHDGEQEMTNFSVVLPPGSLAKLVGVSRCGDAAIAAARGRSGRQELIAPSCPVGSQIGRVEGGVGVGSQLLYVPGRVYLAGPYKGAPLSVVAIVPGVAGPFDVGTVVTRQALDLDPVTGIARVDGSKSDPIPHILAGIPLKIRDVRVYVDRPGFTLNPTNCDPEAFGSQIWGSGADLLGSGDDSPVSRSAHFQVSRCSKLGFKPRLSLKLKGGTKRNDHPSLRSVLTYPRGPGYANVDKAVVKLPSSEFIDNAHIQNPCTRVQFNAGRCPRGSLLGTARAITPLLEQPLEGPVYFRSNGGEHLLPDVVADLHGLFHIVLVGHVDAKGGRIRTTFENVPDAPVSKFSLRLKGGSKGLLVNSRNLCAKRLRADVDLTAQNGRVFDTNRSVGTDCRGKGRHKRR
jgi:hypothetical protein